MARTVTLTELRAWARQLADVENDPNVTDAELTALANRHMTELYDQLVDAGPPDYYAATSTVTTVVGTAAYALPADFRSMVDLYAHESTDERRAIFPMGQGERGQYKPPTGVWTFTLEYVPTPTALVNGSDTLDGVSGWEELVANLMARDVMVKRESDPSVVINTIDRLMARIQSRARTRDRGHPRYVSDLDEQAASGWPVTANHVQVQAYRLRGGFLELYEPLAGLS